MSISSRILPGSTILVLGFAIFSAANANDKANDRASALESRFKGADKDQDGKLSKSEAEKGMPRVFKNFEVIDKDKDGYVTLSEIGAVMNKS